MTEPQDPKAGETESAGPSATGCESASAHFEPFPNGLGASQPAAPEDDDESVLPDSHRVHVPPTAIPAPTQHKTIETETVKINDDSDDSRKRVTIRTRLRGAPAAQPEPAGVPDAVSAPVPDAVSAPAPDAVPDAVSAPVPDAVPEAERSDDAAETSPSEPPTDPNHTLEDQLILRRATTSNRSWIWLAAGGALLTLVVIVLVVRAGGSPGASAPGSPASPAAAPATAGEPAAPAAPAAPAPPEAIANAEAAPEPEPAAQPEPQPEAEPAAAPGKTAPKPKATPAAPKAAAPSEPAAPAKPAKPAASSTAPPKASFPNPSDIRRDVPF